MSFLDAVIPETQVVIEQKSLDKDLDSRIKQSDGSLLTPLEQVQRYAVRIPRNELPRWVVTSNFKEFMIFDWNHPNEEPQRILLKDLPKEYYRLNFLVDVEDESIKKETEISLQAGEIVGDLYNALLKEYLKVYKNSNDPEMLENLNILTR